MTLRSATLDFDCDRLKRKGNMERQCRNKR